MLASRWKIAHRFVSSNDGASKSYVAPKTGLSCASVRRYSTVRRRVVKSDSDMASKLYTTEDPAAVEKRRKELDREFDDTFFRKPKVLIIGTDVTAMTTALCLSSYNIKPDILDTGHYMHPLSPTNLRARIVPMNSMRVFENLGIQRQIESIGTPLGIYGRSDGEGNALATLNFDSLRTYQDRPTLGVNYLELERTLQSIVSEKMQIQPQCVVESIESPNAPDTRMALVKWISGYLGRQEQKKGLYDCVIVSDGPFSIEREKHWSGGFDLEGVATLFEAVIPRPAKIMKGYASDQWGMDRRVGFFPFGGAAQDQLYVFAQIPYDRKSTVGTSGSSAASTSETPTQQRVPATAMLEHFTEFGGPWRDIAEAVSAQSSINRTVLVNGNFKPGNGPVKGRVVALGESSIALPTPCLGHELGIATDMAQHLADSIAFNSAPLLAGIYSLNQNYGKLVPIADVLRNELKAAIHFRSSLPNFFKRWMLKSSYSDRTLAAQQMEFLGLKMSKSQQQDLLALSRIQTLRKEWHTLDDAGREQAKLQFKAELDKQTQAMEKELTELAHAQAAQQAQKKQQAEK